MTLIQNIYIKAINYRYYKIILQLSFTFSFHNRNTEHKYNRTKCVIRNKLDKSMYLFAVVKKDKYGGIVCQSQSTFIIEYNCGQ